MSKWKMVKLEDLCTFITDGTHQTPNYCDDKSGYVFLSSKNVVSGSIDWNNVKYIPKELHAQLYKRVSPQLDDLLLAKNGTTGVAALVDRDCVFDIYVSLALLRPKAIILPRYFLHAINSPFTKRKFNANLKGIGVPNLHLENIKRIDIPLPPLDEQRQIAATLDAVFDLLKLRKQKLAKLDKLVESVFYDMFGDPVTNEKKWEIRTLQQLTTRLGDGLHGTPVFSETGQYYFINGNNLADGKIVISNFTKRVSREEYDKYKKPLDDTTMLVSINGSLGRVAFYNNENIVLGKSACYFNVDSRVINCMFLYHVLKSDYFKNYAMNCSTGSTIQNVSLKSMREFPVLFPPLSIQNLFAFIVQKIEKQKALVQQSIDETQELFYSLMNEYFDE